MDTIAYLLIIISILIMRGVAKGRVLQAPTDLRDTFVAILRGDTAALKEIGARTGTANTVEPGVVAAQSGTTTPPTGDLITEVKRLGSAAKGYRIGGTGPDYYDCSGLVWRAVRNLGIYSGVRFTTRSFAVASVGWCTPVNNPGLGDIVVWSATVPAHMGVIDGPDTFYSALSPRSGIKSMRIADHGGTPRFYRITYSANIGGRPASDRLM
jgi:NlpC/P60 family